MKTEEFSQHVEAVRRFNRFYTKQIGVLHEGLLQSPFSLTEARVIYELAHHESTTARALSSELGLDPGYLSRILRSFKRDGLIDQTPSSADRRQTLLSLTQKGKAAFATINSRSHHEIGETLHKLSESDQSQLIRAMQIIEEILDAQPERRVPYLLRPHQPGDMGWVVHRHGVLYAAEYGWDETFEGLVAQIVADFINNFDPEREYCWMAEMNGSIVGSVFVVKESDTVAKLRLLLLEPHARGVGLGRRLVEECIRFARRTGYQKLTLWTNSVLVEARRIYEKQGFQLVQEEAHSSFGHELIGQYWALEL